MLILTLFLKIKLFGSFLHFVFVKNDWQIYKMAGRILLEALSREVVDESKCI